MKKVERVPKLVYPNIPIKCVYLPYDNVFIKCSRGEINTENQPTRSVIVSSITSSMYESIPNTITEFHEPARDLNVTVGHHNTRNAYDNPIYSENIS